LQVGVVDGVDGINNRVASREASERFAQLGVEWQAQCSAKATNEKKTRDY